MKSPPETSTGSDLSRQKALIMGLFVLEPARGQGVARPLLEAVMDAAASRPGFLVVSLTATGGNRPALAFYESLGFSTFGIETLAIGAPQGFRSQAYLRLAT